MSVHVRQLRAVAHKVDDDEVTVKSEGRTVALVPNGEEVTVLQIEGSDVKVCWKTIEGWTTLSHVALQPSPAASSEAHQPSQELISFLPRVKKRPADFYTRCSDLLAKLGIYDLKALAATDCEMMQHRLKSMDATVGQMSFLNEAALMAKSECHDPMASAASPEATLSTNEISLTEDIVKPLLDMGFERENIIFAVESLSGAEPPNTYFLNQVVETLMGTHPRADLLRQTSRRSSSSSTSHAPTSSGTVVRNASMESVAETMDTAELTASARVLSDQSREVADEAQLAGVSLQSVVRLLLRVADYDRRNVITAEERDQTKALLRLGECQKVRKMLQNANIRHLEQPRPICPICMEEIADEDIFKLGCGHVYCRECMRGQCNAEAFPTCAEPSCKYEFTEEEIGRAAGIERLQAYRDMQLQQALDKLPDRVECPNPSCPLVVTCDPGVRERITCTCGWPPFCSQCRQLYHFFGECNDVGTCLERWVQWNDSGREEYHGKEAAAARAAEKYRSAEDALRRLRELEADEKYKAENCRCCPHCGRVVQKLSGCDLMKCGQNYHGGDKQDGCGAGFKFSEAPRYKPRVEKRSVPALEFEQVKIEGKDVRHFFVSCDSCQARNICGPRFRCLHCPEFNICSTCDLNPPATFRHQENHVFEILWAAEQRFNLDLPAGAKVELIGLIRNSTLNKTEAVVKQFSAARQDYDLELCEEVLVPDLPTRSLGLARIEPKPKFARNANGDWLVSKIQQATRRWLGYDAFEEVKEKNNRKQHIEDGNVEQNANNLDELKVVLRREDGTIAAKVANGEVLTVLQWQDDQVRLCWKNVEGWAKASRVHAAYMVCGIEGRGSNCNGLYVESSKHQNRPAFTAPSGAIIYWDNIWRMCTKHGSPEYFSSVPTSAGQKPPTGPWAAHCGTLCDAGSLPWVEEVITLADVDDLHLVLVEEMAIVPGRKFKSLPRVLAQFVQPSISEGMDDFQVLQLLNADRADQYVEVNRL